MIQVWEAIEISGTLQEEIRKKNNEYRHCVVKDVWLDKDSHTEENNLSKIFAALDNVDIDHYMQNVNINITDSKGLKSIITDILYGRQYNQYFMAIKCDQQGKLTKEYIQGANPNTKIFNTKLI